jgi:hypothetical protein
MEVVPNGNGFTQVSPAVFGTEAQLSPFLIDEVDQFVDPRIGSPVYRPYKELARRATVLQHVANAFCGAVLLPRDLSGIVFRSPVPPVLMQPILASH